MPELSHIDPGSAALLVMDYQVDILTKFMTAAQSADAIAQVPDLIAMARDAGMMVPVQRAEGKRNGGGHAPSTMRPDAPQFHGRLAPRLYRRPRLSRRRTIGGNFDSLSPW
jgi:nicotinamidase-related amidase